MWTLLNLTINAPNYPLKGKNTTGYHREIKLIHRRSLHILTYTVSILNDISIIYIYKIVISVCLSVCFSDHNSGKLGPIYFNYPELKL